MIALKSTFFSAVLRQLLIPDLFFFLNQNEKWSSNNLRSSMPFRQRNMYMALHEDPNLEDKYHASK